MDWIETNSYLKGIDNHLKKLPSPVRIAAFDLDDTIIHRPKTRGKIVDKRWKLLGQDMIDRIQELIDQKYIIVIFTNQSGMGSGRNFNKTEWRQAMDHLMAKIANGADRYYLAVYVAKQYDLNRKPNIGLWTQMKNDLKEEFGLDKLAISKKSFFCGDAGGRLKPSKYRKKLYPKSPKGDFADTDRKFALNIGIDYLTPEEFMGDDTAEKYRLTGIDPQKLIDDVETDTDNHYTFEPRKKEMIVMIGPPGSGKSHFVKKYILPHGYVHVNRDTCKTKVKCIKLATAAVERDKSLVIDNTNPDVISRMEYTTIAKEHGYQHIRAIVLDTDIDVAKHLNNVRHVYSDGSEAKIHKIVYNIFNKNFVRPIKTEYFDKIESVHFTFDPEQLDDLRWKKIFLRYSGGSD